MRRLFVVVAALLAVATALILGYYCALAVPAVVQMPRRYGYHVEWSVLALGLPALLLAGELLLSAWRAIRWAVTPVGSHAAWATQTPRLGRIVMLLAAAPPAGLILAAVLQDLRVWSDSSIGVWQLLLYPSLLIAPLLMVRGYPRETSAGSAAASAPIAASTPREGSR